MANTELAIKCWLGFIIVSLLYLFITKQKETFKITKPTTSTSIPITKNIKSRVEKPSVVKNPSIVTNPLNLNENAVLQSGNPFMQDTYSSNPIISIKKSNRGI